MCGLPAPGGDRWKDGGGGGGRSGLPPSAGTAPEGALACLQVPGQHRRALWPASKCRDSTGPVALEPPTATSTPSWLKVSANGIGTPRSRTAGAPCSPCTQEHDLSTRTSWPVTHSHASVVGTA